MARKGRLEQKLARLSALRNEPPTQRACGELRNSLDDTSPHVVAKAAGVIGELGLVELADGLEAAFERLMAEPTKTDKGCVAKAAVIKSLVGLEHQSSEIFLRGLHHVQMEPSYGGPVDTAVELRCRSAFGLAATGDPDAVLELVTALADRETPVRRAAIEALAATGRREVEPLLRLKVLAGDRSPDILTEGFLALLEMAPERSLPFVERFLDSPEEEVAEAAALALGSSRRDESFDILARRLRDRIDTAFTRTLLLALSMLRRERSLGLLLDMVAKAPQRRAQDALQALAIHRHDESIRQRVEAAIASREDRTKLRILYEREFRV